VAAAVANGAVEDDEVHGHDDDAGGIDEAVPEITNRVPRGVDDAGDGEAVVVQLEIEIGRAG